MQMITKLRYQLKLDAPNLLRKIVLNCLIENRSLIM